MSLDVDLMVTQPTSVYSSNITHNLVAMAGAVELSNDKYRNACWDNPDAEIMVSR